MSTTWSDDRIMTIVVIVIPMILIIDVTAIDDDVDIQVGRIIGKGGGNVREMQRLTGAVIKLPEQVFASSKFCSVSKSKNLRARQLEKRRACTSSVRSTRPSPPSAGSEPWWRDRREESRPTRCCPCEHNHHHHHHPHDHHGTQVPPLLPNGGGASSLPSSSTDEPPAL